MTGFNEFIDSLGRKLIHPLPGLEAQLKMATLRRDVQFGKMVVPEDAKKSSVLILFYPSGEDISLVFMKRTEYQGVHSGQISFPGGSWELGDDDMVMTALREAEEEIGVDRASVLPIGKLSELFIPPSKFLVTPVVGYTRQRPSFRPDPVEVAKILEVPLDLLLQEETRQVRAITAFPDYRLDAPCFYVDGEIIWGATAMILNELIEVISQGS